MTSEIRYADATDGEAEFVPVWPRRKGSSTRVEHAVVGGEDRFLILHNDGAENFTLVEAPVSDPTAHPDADRAPRRRPPRRRRRVRRALRGQLPQRGPAADPAVAALRRRHLRQPGGPHVRRAELTSAGLSATPSWDSPVLRIGYDVVRHPGARLRRRPGHRRAHAAARAAGARRLPTRGLRERRDWAVAADGARMPISIIHRAGDASARPDAALRLWLYESCEDPRFSIAAAVAARPRHGLRDRPCARRRRDGPAVVRARQAAGEANTFTDFVAARGTLIDPT